MKKLLLLLPLMALASCSGGDVLKSNRPFEMVCGDLVWSIDPEMPEASIQLQDSVSIWNLTKVTPDSIVLEQPDVIPGEIKGPMVRIDRNTGKLWLGRTSPAEEGPKCTFNAV